MKRFTIFIKDVTKISCTVIEEAISTVMSTEDNFIYITQQDNSVDLGFAGCIPTDDARFTMLELYLNKIKQVPILR